MYDAVLFDNDGVLLGRTRYDVLQAAAWDAFETVGVSDPDPDDVERIVVGVTPEELRDVADTYDVDPTGLWKARDQAAFEGQRKEMRAGRKTPYEDVSVLGKLRSPLGIVSSNQQATVEFALDHFGLGGLFETAYGREPTVDSLIQKKPNPYYLDRALADLGAEHGLFIGDNESDIVAANNAGIDSAFIRRPHRTEYDLSVTPTYDFENLHDLVAICSAA